MTSPFEMIGNASVPRGSVALPGRQRRETMRRRPGRGSRPAATSATPGRQVPPRARAAWIADRRRELGVVLGVGQDDRVDGERRPVGRRPPEYAQPARERARQVLEDERAGDVHRGRPGQRPRHLHLEQQPARRAVALGHVLADARRSDQAAGVVAQERVVPGDLAPLARPGQDEHLLVRVDRALAHLGHELLVGGVERLGPRAADQLRARVAGQVGEVLVAEGDPAVEVEADGDQVDVLEQLPEPALGLLERAEAGAEVGLELLVLERQAGRAADGLEELRVVGERRVVDERRHPLSRPFDDRDGPVGAFGRIERPPVRVHVDVQVAEPVCELEAGIADRLSQRPSHPAGLVAARELVDQLCDSAGAGQARAQDPDQEPERDARKGQRRDDECDRADGRLRRRSRPGAPRRSSRCRRRSSQGRARAPAAPRPRPTASAGSRSRRRPPGARRRPPPRGLSAADATSGWCETMSTFRGRSASFEMSCDVPTRLTSSWTPRVSA